MEIVKVRQPVFISFRYYGGCRPTCTLYRLEFDMAWSVLADDQQILGLVDYFIVT